MTKGYKTYLKLKDEGWTFVHEAAYHGYKSAGTISPMNSKGGFEYCRIHQGKSVGSSHKYQLTTVMKRSEV